MLIESSKEAKHSNRSTERDFDMIPSISSLSATLAILQTQAPQAAPALPEPNPFNRSLDPRPTHHLRGQSLDALLQLRAELWRDQSHELQSQRSLLPASSVSATGQMGVLAWENGKSAPRSSYLDWWTEQMASLKARSTIPLNSSLMPWNSPEVIQQWKDWDEHSMNSEARIRAFRANDAAIYKSMSETPPEDAAEIRAKGGTLWYEYSQFSDRISDKEFFRNIKNFALYGGNLTDPIDPSDERSQALLNGTAQIIRGSKIPELQYSSAVYNYYEFNADANQYKWAGGFGRDHINQEYIKDLEKKNPSMHVSVIWANNDVAFILYPKTASAQAVAQGSVAATDTKPAAEPAH
jgi:hypothetical protein